MIEVLTVLFIFVVVALGSVFAGVWCDDDKLRESVESAAEATGD